MPVAWEVAMVQLVVTVTVRDLTHEDLPACGLGTILVRAAEQRILARGLDRAELGVEVNNPRARSLYERLGYVAYSRRPEAWDEELPDGSLTRYETVCTLTRKRLS